MKIVVWWIRRTLRLQDHPVLQQAIMSGYPVLPLYIFDPKILRTESFRGDFLVRAVRGLEHGLTEMGYTMLTAFGNPADVFQELFGQCEVVQIFTEKEVTPYGKKQLETLQTRFPLQMIPAVTVYEAEEILKPDGTAYQKYSAYRSRWLQLPLPACSFVEMDLPLVKTLPCSLPFPKSPPGIEAVVPFLHQEAESTLSRFLLERSMDYERYRNRVDLDGTSHCSSFFRFGLLSPRQVVSQINQFIQAEPHTEEKTGRQSWRDELIWREFFNHLMDSYISEAQRLENRDGSEISWRQNEQDLQAWQQGRTGYPLVDAAMRQLVQTGWMPGRARMVVASFLTKDLFLWWHWGEQFFMRYLLDGDPAANHGNWQWVAGIGTDAAPFFRIFNPITQSKKFDPNGTYIRTWVPELKQVPVEFIHEPWKMNQQDQVITHCRIDIHYPGPMVDHAMARLRALDLFRLRTKRIENS